MFYQLIALVSLFFVAAESCFADNCCTSNCCAQSLEIGVGWRRDTINWKVDDYSDSFLDVTAFSQHHIRDMDMYTCYAKARWVDTCYYIRLDGDYGTMYKGRSHETFGVESPFLRRLGGSAEISTSDPIKRRGEAYDFNIAFGYPLNFDYCRCCCIIPTVGFSFHRQQFQIDHDIDSLFSSCCSGSSCFSSDGPFRNRRDRRRERRRERHEFAGIVTRLERQELTRRERRILNLIGECAFNREDGLRFTWYSPYVGTDIYCALDSCWTLFAELEAHIFGQCHRKRDTDTALVSVNEYHSTGKAYGFNGVVGVTLTMQEGWYATLTTDLRWWHSNARNFEDHLEWRSAGVNFAFGYIW